MAQAGNSEPKKAMIAAVQAISIFVQIDSIIFAYPSDARMWRMNTT